MHFLVWKWLFKLYAILNEMFTCIIAAHWRFICWAFANFCWVVISFLSRSGCCWAATMPPKKKKSGKKGKKGKKSGKTSAKDGSKSEHLSELSKEFYLIQIRDLENRLSRWVLVWFVCPGWWMYTWFVLCFTFHLTLYMLNFAEGT